MSDLPTLLFDAPDAPEWWLPVVDWKGFYEVSSAGKVRSLSRRTTDGRNIKGRVLRQSLAARGYPHVVLSADGRRRTVAVHVLVATAFHGPPPAGMEVRHLDDNKLNPAASNLIWGTRSENIQDRRTNGIMYQLNRTHCPHKHEWTEANTIIITRADGSFRERVCRECKNGRRRERRRERQAA